MRLGQELTSAQRAAAEHLSASTAWWSPSASVAAEGLGRGAGRARSTLDAIARLSEAAATYTTAAGNYTQHNCEATLYEKRHGSDDGAHVVGSIKTCSAGPVVPIVSSRLKLFEKPSFDPRPLLTARSRALYERPGDFRIPATTALPVDRVLASQSEFLLLLGQLDKSERLVLRLASESDRSGRVGLQCT